MKYYVNKYLTLNIGGFIMYLTIRKHIDGIWLLINGLFDGLWTLLDKGRLNRRAAHWVMIYITLEAYHFCYRAAETSNWDPMTIAAAFAILTPVSALQASMAMSYNGSKDRDADEKISIRENELSHRKLAIEERRLTLEENYR